MPTHLKGNRHLAFGDSIWEFEYNYHSPLTRIITKRAAGVSYNVAIGGSCFGRHPNANYDALSMVELSNAKVLNDWTDQDAAVAALKILPPPNTDNNTKQIQIMKGISFYTPNMNQTNIITLAFGTNDFNQSRPIGDDSDSGKETFKGAINWVLTRFMGNFRRSRIMLGTPIWKANGGTPNLAGHTLKDYANAIVTIGSLRSVPVLDLYHCSGINADNDSTLLADGTHPSADGYELLGDLWASALLSRF